MRPLHPHGDRPSPRPRVAGPAAESLPEVLGARSHADAHRSAARATGVRCGRAPVRHRVTRVRRPRGPFEVQPCVARESLRSGRLPPLTPGRPRRHPSAHGSRPRAGSNTPGWLERLRSLVRQFDRSNCSSRSDEARGCSREPGAGWRSARMVRDVPLRASESERLSRAAVNTNRAHSMTTRRSAPCHPTRRPANSRRSFRGVKPGQRAGTDALRPGSGLPSAGSPSTTCTAWAAPSSTSGIARGSAGRPSSTASARPRPRCPRFSTVIR